LHTVAKALREQSIIMKAPDRCCLLTTISRAGRRRQKRVPIWCAFKDEPAWQNETARPSWPLQGYGQADGKIWDRNL